MTDKKFKLEIVTPERKIFSAMVDFAIFPGTEGELGVLIDHAPLVSRLSPGVIRITRDGALESLAISGGFLEVMKNDVSVLSETAELAAEIDVARAQAAKADAEAGVKKASTDEEKLSHALDLQKAIARLAAASQVKAPH